MFNFHHLHYFWAVAHEGNLTRAAVRLHVSQSAVSMQIQKLEAELGHALFERRGKRLILTEAGRIALDHADAIFAHGRELESSLAGSGTSRDTLRVGSIATLSRNFQLGFLAPLFKRDDVEVVVRSGSFPDMLRLLEAHTLDVVLANIAPPRDASTSWVAHAIAKQSVSLVGRPTRKRRPKALRELLASEALVLPSAESSIRVGFDALASRLGVRPRIAAEVDDMAMLRLLARERLGLAVVPPIVVQDELRSGVLVEVAPLPLVETFFAITLTRRFPNPLLKTLLRVPPNFETR
jgi:LysR family transcriptional activator of nhaA